MRARRASRISASASACSSRHRVRSSRGGLDGANSTEFDPDTRHPVVALITEWQNRDGTIERRAANSDMGGTMRLGGQPCEVVPGSLAHRVYGSTTVAERHRHRYEVNNHYLPRLGGGGSRGRCAREERGGGDLCEMIELKQHPWFFGCQFHPEFTSNPRRGHPLFIGFVRAALDRQRRASDGSERDAVAELVAELVNDELCGFDVGLDRPLFLIADPASSNRASSRSTLPAS
jgi:hypothetical protein